MKKKLLSLILCLTLLLSVLPAGALSLTAAAAEADTAVTGLGTSMDDPLIVHSYAELKSVFDQTNTSGDIFVKLGNDISYKGYERGTLITNGASVTLDLAGYTFSVEDSSNNSFTVIHGDNGSVTITDTGRYDTSETWGHLVNGKIDYLYTLPDRDTAVLSGSITVNNGWIVNRTHSSDDSHTNSAYSSGKIGNGRGVQWSDSTACLTMNGGILEADVPINLGSADRRSVINGGYLYVKGAVGIRIKTDSGAYAFPTIIKTDMRNNSGNSVISAFDVKLEDGFEDNHSTAEAMAIWKKIVSDESRAYVDHILLAEGNHGVYYDAVGGLIGPLFKSSYVLTPMQTIGQINLTIDEPAVGEEMSYKAKVKSSDYQAYEVTSFTAYNWKDGVMWTDGSKYTDEYPVGSTFAAGKSYTVFIKVNTWLKGYQFADEDTLTATINGKRALVYKSGNNEYTAYRSFSVDFALVTAAKITVTAPKAGQLPSFTASVPSDKGYAVQTSYSATGIKNGVSWMHANGSALADGEKFQAGQKYLVLVFITLTDSTKYQFASYDSIDATINNNQATALPYSSTRYGITYAFDLSNQIGSIDITIPSTGVGEQMKWAASAPENADYEIGTSGTGLGANGVLWRIDNSTVAPGKVKYFEDGVSYTVSISVKIKDGAGKTFAAADALNAAVNGQSATNVSRLSDTKVSISYTFTASASVISSVSVSVTAPVAGEAPVYSASVSDGAGYEIYVDESSHVYKNGVGWFRITDGTTYYLDPNSSSNSFRAGYVYRVGVVLKLKTGYEFSGNLTGTINGQASNISNYYSSKDKIFITYVFPELEQTAAVIKSFNVTIPEPKAGGLISYSASAMLGKGYEVEDYSGIFYKNGVLWIDGDDNYISPNTQNYFEAGHTYTVKISMVPTDYELYRFGDPAEMTATVNGNSAKIIDLEDTNYLVSYTFTLPSASKRILGDADDDGEVSILDATCIQRHLAELATAKYVEAAADADGDGEVSILDATAIQRYLAELETNKNIGKQI